VVTIEGALDELGHFLEYHILSRRGGEYLVKLELVYLANVLAQDGNLAIGEDVDGRMPLRDAVGWQDGSCAHVNADIASQLLDVVVQCTTDLLSAEELILELSDPAIAFFDPAITFFDPAFTFFDPRLQDGGVLVRCAATFNRLLMRIVAGALPLPDFGHASLPGLYRINRHLPKLWC
jgi:hypothetical protein